MRLMKVGYLEARQTPLGVMYRQFDYLDIELQIRKMKEKQNAQPQ